MSDEENGLRLTSEAAKKLERDTHGLLHPNDAEIVVQLARESEGPGGFRARLMDRMPKLIPHADQITGALYSGWAPSAVAPEEVAPEPDAEGNVAGSSDEDG